MPITAFSVSCGEENLVEFEPGMFRYEGVLDEADAGATLLIRAAADEGIELEILVDAISKGTGNLELISSDVPAPHSGDTAVSIEVRARRGGAMTSYTAEISPAQSEASNDSTLQSIVVSYNSGAANRLAPSFTKEGLSYSMASEQGMTTGYVKAVASSSAATVEIWYDNQQLTGLASGNGMIERPFTLPGRNASKTLSIKVTSEDLASNKLYSVQVFGYEDQTHTYTGTVTCTLANYTIKGVTAINSAAGTQGAQVHFDAAVANGYEWELSTVETWVPTAFTVTLEKTVGDQKYAIESVAFPVPQANPNVPIPLQISAASQVGYRIFDANDFYYYLNTQDYRTENFSLAANIDLADYRDPNSGQLVDWTGPSDFQGRLYGNGYTVKNLVLSKPAGNTGLFATVGAGAFIENFTLEASLAPGAKTRTDNSYFGGLVGYIDNTDTVQEITFRDITIKGDLAFTGTTTDTGGGYDWFLVGGFVGEIKRAHKVNIENCVSKLNISVDNYQWNQNSGNNICGFGGLVGRIGATGGFSVTVSILNSYATGNISVKGSTQYSRMFAGGLVGDIYSNNGGATTTVTIEDCYSSGCVSVENQAAWNLGAALIAAGSSGLVGGVWKGSGNTTVAITNCAAVGEKAVLTAANTSSGVYLNSRFTATPPSGSYMPTQLALTNNIARKGMVVGINTEAADNDSGSGDAQKALGKTLADLKTKAVWLALTWSEVDWDFSGLSQGNWPALR